MFSGSSTSSIPVDVDYDATHPPPPRPSAAAIAASKGFFHKAPWFIVHSLLQATGVGFLILSVAIILFVAGADHVQWGPHQSAGVATVVFTILQATLGAVRPDPESPYRERWLWVHRGLGVLAFAMGLATIPLGVQVRGGR
jgi:hypothetical protein